MGHTAASSWKAWLHLKMGEKFKGQQKGRSQTHNSEEQCVSKIINQKLQIVTFQLFAIITKSC
jgi:hypothetical protein